MLCTELISNENVKEVQTSYRPRDILLPDSSAARTEILSGRTERKSRKLNISKTHCLCRIYASKDAQEGFKLRQALRCARNVFKMKVEIRNNRLLMVDSGLSYSLQELPEYLKKELRQYK